MWNNMVNIDEKTVSLMKMHLLKKFTVNLHPTSSLNTAQWSLGSGFITVGGGAGKNRQSGKLNKEGTLRNLKLSFPATEEPNPLEPLNMSSHQSLSGHTCAEVIHAAWNERYQTLATGDDAGLLILWQQKEGENWKSIGKFHVASKKLIGLCWNEEGTKCLHAYDVGPVFACSVDGRRVWNIKTILPISACEWVPESDKVIFGTEDGNVIVYHENGTRFQTIEKCSEEQERFEILRPPPSKVLFIKYWSPARKPVDSNMPANQDAPIEVLDPSQPIPADRPRLAIIYENGDIQIMKTIDDKYPVVTALRGLVFRDVKWSPNGAFLAIAGVHKKSMDHSQICLISAYGQFIGGSKAPGRHINAISWEHSGLRMAIAADRILYLTQVSPMYKFGATQDTLVYVYQTPEARQYIVRFHDFKKEESLKKEVKNFENLVVDNDKCVIVSRKDQYIQYNCELCDITGASLDETVTSVTPKFVRLNKNWAVIASERRYCIWNLEKKSSQEYILVEQAAKIDTISSKNKINSICIGDTFFLLALENCGIYRINLTDGAVTTMCEIDFSVETMKFNCDLTRLAVLINGDETLKLYNYNKQRLDSSKSEEWLYNHFSIEGKLIWDYLWDPKNSQQFAFLDRSQQKSILFICNGQTVKEQRSVLGRLFSVGEKEVQMVMMDEILLTPETPPQKTLQTVELTQI